MDGGEWNHGGIFVGGACSALLMNRKIQFMESSFLIVAILSVVVFCLFNFRPKNRAKCFAGDVGSIGIAFILLFSIGKLVIQTGDITWLSFLVVYGVDGCLTICHRIMLHENLERHTVNMLPVDGE